MTFSACESRVLGGGFFVMKKLSYIVAALGLVCVGLLSGCSQQESSVSPPMAPATNMPATNAPNMPATNMPAPNMPATNAPAQ
jgi:hypothetical protein